MYYPFAFVAMIFFATFSSPAYAQTKADIAKAYVQAITGGTGSKVAGAIDFDALDCTPATVFVENKCPKVLRNGKDGKTFLMESITADTIAVLVPLEDVRRVYSNLYDATYADVRGLLGYLSTQGSGWYSDLDGAGNAKAILQAHLESTGPGGMYGDFVWPFDAATPPQAKITAAGVDFKITTLPAAAALDATQFPLYYWALQTNFSDMAYPPGFVYPQIPGKAPATCRRTTTAWGHVGLQYAKENPDTPNKTIRQANWGATGRAWTTTAAAAVM